MDLFDELLDKAKDVFDVAVKTTEGVVDTGKQKYEIASLENKISKDFKALGELYYKQQKGGEVDSSEFESLLADIDDKKIKVNELKGEVNKSKAERYCAACGAPISQAATVCPVCGAQLEYTTQE